MLTGSYETLFSYSMVAAWIFYTLSVGAVFLLRRSEPDRPRPYRMWGYPYTLWLFILVSVWFIANALCTQLVPSLMALVIILTGVPAYLLFRRCAANSGEYHVGSHIASKPAATCDSLNTIRTRMATTTEPVINARLTDREQVPAAPPASTRLVSLDAYRGLIMLLLISHGFGFSVLKSYPHWAWLSNQVDHTDWTGCTFWDLIQPAFTFMVGMAMPFAFARRQANGATNFDLFRHVAWRALVLIVLSNILSNFDSRAGRPVLQLINVLCQIAFGYLMVFGITRLRFSWQVACGVLLIGGYWALFVLFPGPDGPFSKTGNIGAVIDRKLLGYNYSGVLHDHQLPGKCCHHSVRILGGDVDADQEVSHLQTDGARGLCGSSFRDWPGSPSHSILW